MTGLKSGAGDDLWNDDREEEEEAEREEGEKEEEERWEREEGREGRNGMERDEGPTDHDDARSGESGSTSGRGTATNESSDEPHPYIVRRAIQDKSVQFERDERLTFFVHEDVVDGERELVSEVAAALGRDVPKFDVREAVYRAALRNRDDVLAELLKMGYSLEER